MRRTIFIVITLFVLFGTLGQQQFRSTANPEALIAHGQYLVERVAMCVQCHTPRDEKGHLIYGRLLQGAPIPVKSPYPNQEWAFQAPNIAGLIGYNGEEGIRLLTEGINRNGVPPRPPMPPFRLSRQDAAAIVAYLKSLR